MTNKTTDAPRCGFCGRLVDGEKTAIALPSERFAAHPASLVGPIYGTSDYEVYTCANEEGCR